MQLSTKDLAIAQLNEKLVEMSTMSTTTTRNDSIDSKNMLLLSKLPLVGSAKQGEFTGLLYKIKSKYKYLTHALVNTKTRKTICYLHFNETPSKYEKQIIKIQGTVRKVKGWSSPVLLDTKVIK